MNLSCIKTKCLLTEVYYTCPLHSVNIAEIAFAFGEITKVIVTLKTCLRQIAF